MKKIERNTFEPIWIIKQPDANLIKEKLGKKSQTSKNNYQL